MFHHAPSPCWVRPGAEPCGAHRCGPRRGRAALRLRHRFV